MDLWKQNLWCRNSRFHASGMGKPRACILVKKHLIAFSFPQFSEGDVTTQRLKPDERSIVICSFYLAHDHPEPVPIILLRNLVREKANSNILLGGDAKAHHVIWGSSDINVSGELLYDYILFNNIYVINKVWCPMSRSGSRKLRRCNKVTIKRSLAYCIITKNANVNLSYWAIVWQVSDH